MLASIFQAATRMDCRPAALPAITFRLICSSRDTQATMMAMTINDGGGRNPTKI